MKPRYTIPFRGLKEGSDQWEWTIGEEFWKAHPEGGIIGGEVAVAAVSEVSATSGRAPSSVTRLRVAMSGSVIVPCDRCLEECELPVEFEGSLAVKTAEEEQPFDGEVMWLLPGEGVIDLEQYIYESIVLSLPLQRVHPEDVHGQPLCNPAMLERFKIVTEEEFEQLNNNIE